MSPETGDLEVTLAPDVTAPERARRHLEEVGDHLSEEMLDDVKLLVVELVTNSVKFAGNGTIALKLVAEEDSIRVEVHDEGPGFSPSAHEPAPDDISGRGLFLVEALADRWGVTRADTTCVWFEIDAAKGAA